MIKYYKESMSHFSAELVGEYICYVTYPKGDEPVYTARFKAKEDDFTSLNSLYTDITEKEFKEHLVMKLLDPKL